MLSRDEICGYLKNPLAAERVKQHPFSKMDYLETHDVISNLNGVFGFDGWKYHVNNLSQVDAAGHFWKAVLTLEVRFGDEWISRQDVGFGAVSQRKDSAWIETAAEYDKALKSAVSDGLKRAARTLGNQFGNSLYEKDPALRYEHAEGTQPAARPQSAARPDNRPQSAVGQALEQGFQESRRAPSQAGGNAGRGIVEGVEQKETKTGKPYWRVKISGVGWLSTWHKTVGELAPTLDGCEVDYTYSVKGDFKNLETMAGVQQAPLGTSAAGMMQDDDGLDPFEDE